MGQAAARRAVSCPCSRVDFPRGRAKPGRCSARNENEEQQQAEDRQAPRNENEEQQAEERRMKLQAEDQQTPCYEDGQRRQPQPRQVGGPRHAEAKAGSEQSWLTWRKLRRGAGATVAAVPRPAMGAPRAGAPQAAPSHYPWPLVACAADSGELAPPAPPLPPLAPPAPVRAPSPASTSTSTCTASLTPSALTTEPASRAVTPAPAATQQGSVAVAGAVEPDRPASLASPLGSPAARAPARQHVKCPEMPELSGAYAPMPTARVRGEAVWASGMSRLYADPHGHWRLSDRPVDMGAGVG